MKVLTLVLLSFLAACAPTEGSYLALIKASVVVDPEERFQRRMERAKSAAFARRMAELDAYGKRRQAGEPMPVITHRTRCQKLLEGNYLATWELQCLHTKVKDLRMPIIYRNPVVTLIPGDS